MGLGARPPPEADLALSLQPPSDESLNGLLQGYRIYYRELEPEAATGPESAALKTPSALRSELTGEPALPSRHSRQASRRGGSCPGTWVCHGGVVGGPGGVVGGP